MKKTIMIMIDGFGIPESGWGDSVYSKYCAKEFVDLMAQYSIPIDAGMGVLGLPQSATGQTALFTGQNAARIMNRHIQGFPRITLKKIIKEKNLFSELKANGLKVIFANAYVQHTLDELLEKGLGSVTTVMTKESLGVVRNLSDLRNGNAVYHDITRKSIVGRFAVNAITPEQGARDLIKIASQYDFSLFEYFLTDRAGHKCDCDFLASVLNEFSDFFCRLIGFAKNEIAVILTSDHGNCEDLENKRHTMNPVPLFAYGLPMPLPRVIKGIEDVFNYIISLGKNGKV